MSMDINTTCHILLRLQQPIPSLCTVITLMQVMVLSLLRTDLSIHLRPQLLGPTCRIQCHIQAQLLLITQSTIMYLPTMLNTNPGTWPRCMSRTARW